MRGRSLTILHSKKLPGIWGEAQDLSALPTRFYQPRPQAITDTIATTNLLFHPAHQSFLLSIEPFPSYQQPPPLPMFITKVNKQKTNKKNKNKQTTQKVKFEVDNQPNSWRCCETMTKCIIEIVLIAKIIIALSHDQL